jgi:O-methyltransferase
MNGSKGFDSMWTLFKQRETFGPPRRDYRLPALLPDQLDHLVHKMHRSGELAQLTEAQVSNILFALQEAGFRKQVMDVGGAAYDDGHLVSFHSADFLKEPLFQEAYRLGGQTVNNWHDCDFPWRVYTACWAANHAKGLEGDFVECGVNTGSLSRAAMHYIDFANVTGRMFYLLDTYCGIPEQDRHLAAEGCVPRYRECYEEACRTFAPFANARLIRGRVPETLDQVPSTKVCYLAIDMNCAEPEIAAAEFFWDKLVRGAVVLLDDYGAGPWHLRQRQAFDRFAAQKGVRVFLLPTCQGLIIKP